MKLLFTTAILLSFSAYCFSDDDHGKHAFSYDAETFKVAIHLKKNFVMFYAPWCGHCKNLAPTWDELAKLYNGNSESPVVISKVDCTVHTALCSEHDITGFPTLKLFSVGGADHKRYSGRRDLESLKNFIAQNLVEGEAAPEPKKDVETAKGDGLVVLRDDTFKVFLEQNKFVFVKFYAPWCGHCKRLAPTWYELADSFKDYEDVSVAEIDCDDNPGSCKKHNVRGYPTLILFNKGEMVKKYESDRSLAALENFVKSEINQVDEEPILSDVLDSLKEQLEDADEHELGKVKDLNADNFDGFLSERLVFVKFFAPWCGHCKRLAPVWDDLAKEFEDDDQVAIAKVDCTLHKSVCDNYQVRGYPTLKIFRNGQKLEDYRQSRTLESLTAFVKGFVPSHDEL